jgi:hypothetical protein
MAEASQDARLAFRRCGLRDQHVEVTRIAWHRPGYVIAGIRGSRQQRCQDDGRQPSRRYTPDHVYAARRPTMLDAARLSYSFVWLWESEHQVTAGNPQKKLHLIPGSDDRRSR